MDHSKSSVDTATEAATQLFHSAWRLVRVMQGPRAGKGLSMARFGVLGRLHRGGVATQTSLAAYLRIQPQSLTRLIADLEKEALITRRHDDTDRRRSLLEITEQGKRLLVTEVRDQQARLAEAISRELTPTEQEMLRLATGLMDRLAATAERSPDTGGEASR